MRFWSRPRVPAILQAEPVECGLACVAMVASYWGHRIDLAGMRRRFPVPRTGATLRSLMTMAEAMSLQSRPLRLDLPLLQRLKLPCILHWNTNHFVVLATMEGYTAVIHDPAVGIRRVSMAEISRHFTGVALEMTPSASPASSWPVAAEEGRWDNPGPGHTQSQPMLENSAVTKAMGQALATLLRPLVRLLLKHSFPYSAFEAIAKRVYAQVAMEDFALPGRKPSVSRASILTGLTRKDVNALLQAPWDEIDATSTHYNRAARVVTAWIRDARFVAPGGEPRPLPMEGHDGFAELVRLHGGDVPVRAVLDELSRVGMVHELADGRLELRQRAYVPSENMLPLLGILGTDVGELVETITHNLEPGASGPRFQRKVMHVGIPIDQLAAFQELSARKSQALLEQLDAWLAEHDMGSVPESMWPPGRTAKVGLGIYYVEQVTGDEPAR